MGKTQHPASKYGTDKQYLEWLSYQPSCLDGSFSQYIDGVGRNIACHVRRAGKAGTGYKPPYSAVPMTDAQHKMQSAKGEVAAIKEYTGDECSVENAKDWFDTEAAIYLRTWCITKNKENL